MTTVWLLHDYGEGGDHSDVEGVFATREGAVSAFWAVVARIREDGEVYGRDVDSIEVEWNGENEPVIYEGTGAWYWLIEEVEVQP